MPRYNYPAMVPIVAAFAKANGIEYRRSPLGEMLSSHIATLKRHALEPQAPAA
jgi:hypothetical protein